MMVRRWRTLSYKEEAMKAKRLVLVLVCAASVAALATAGNAAPTPEAVRGEYIVKSGGCTDCHTPKKMGPAGPEDDMTRYLSGHPETLVMPAAPKLPEGPWMALASATFTAWAGPWGTSYTANLTPDRETGLGAWTAQTFVDAIRSGRVMGRGRPILPPMPYPAMQNETDADLKASFAYLATLPAIRNRVPDPVLPEAAAGK
jgi:hypothetical protein